MKHLLFFVSILFIVGCRKDFKAGISQHSFPEQLKLSLQKKLLPEDNSKLDFERAIAAEIKKEKLVSIE